MMTNRNRALCGAFAIALAGMWLASATAAGAVSKKLLLSSRFGWNVNLTKAGEVTSTQAERNVCTVASHDVCQNGTNAPGASGLAFERSVATDQENGTVYVADTGHARVQEFTASGEFVLTFGWKVNKKGGNVCTKAEEAECQGGETGTGLAEQLNGPQDVAVDPATHNIYVLDLFNKRIDEYTPQGVFVLMIGGKVNKKTGGNICRAAEAVECQVGTFEPTGSAQGAFRAFPAQNKGTLLAVGGPEHLLYVADENRIQKLTDSGEWKGEVSLSAISSAAQPVALAVDAAGLMYVVALKPASTEQVGGIHELDAEGKQVPGFPESEAGETKAVIVALALDPGTGRLAAIDLQGGVEIGELYNSTGTRLKSFELEGGFKAADGLAFNASDELYVADAVHKAVEMFVPTPVLELKTGACKSRTADGFTMTAEINPNAVEGTEAWFQYGTSEKALGLATANQAFSAGNAFVPFEATLEGLPPNETYFYRASGKDNLTSEVAEQILSCQTKLVPPNIEGEPEAAYETFSSAVLFGSLNPENASTEYFFEYAPFTSGEMTLSVLCPGGVRKERSLDQAACRGVAATGILESSVYGTTGVALSADDLQPATTYRYRLHASSISKDGNEQSESIGHESSFTTSAAPNLTASTSPVADVTATSAILSGVVDPGGAGGTYAFQLGIYNGTDTVYTTVAQGPTGSGSDPLTESFNIAGLQPGMTYSYRIVISSAYGAAEGASVPFTTAGLPTVVFPPEPIGMLAVPTIAFPAGSKTTSGIKRCKGGHKNSKHDGCARTRKTKRKKAKAHGRRKAKRK